MRRYIKRPGECRQGKGGKGREGLQVSIKTPGLRASTRALQTPVDADPGHK
jgi:hypothetical protein